MTGSTLAPNGVLMMGDDNPIAVPSGQILHLQDVILDEEGPNGSALRFRFIAPQVARNGGNIDAETATSDMRALCDSFVVPRLTELGVAPAQIILSMADVALPFGEAAPENTQFFESFSIKNGICIWEIF